VSLLKGFPRKYLAHRFVSAAVYPAAVAALFLSLVSTARAEAPAVDPNQAPAAAPAAATPAPDAAAPAASAAAPAAAAATPAPASEAPPPAPPEAAAKPSGDSDKAKATTEDSPEFDFEHEKAFMDVPDALRSRQFVHRAILSTIIRDTAKVTLGTNYFTPLLGFDAVYQPANRGGHSFAKYVTGLIGLSFGHVSKSGNMIELDLDISGVSNLSVAYRKLFVSEKVTFWPYLGAGVGTEISLLRLSEVPVEARVYDGSSKMVYGIIGAVIPMVDVAIKAEARFCFYGLDRLMLTTGVGVIFFL